MPTWFWVGGYLLGAVAVWIFWYKLHYSFPRDGDFRHFQGGNKRAAAAMATWHAAIWPCFLVAAGLILVGCLFADWIKEGNPS